MFSSGHCMKPSLDGDHQTNTKELEKLGKLRRKWVFPEQVRMAYLSNCNSTRHWLQLASSKGSLHAQVSQSFHCKLHFKVRQLIALFLYDLCSKGKQNLIALLILFLLTLCLPSLAEPTFTTIQGRQTCLGTYLSTFMQIDVSHPCPMQALPCSSSLPHWALSEQCTRKTEFQDSGYSTAHC